MASPVLHIKDSYYFEVPKPFWQSRKDSIDDFPEWWIRLDPEYQHWEAERQYDKLVDILGSDVVPPKAELIHDFEHWQHADHANFGKPFDDFLTTQPWFAEQMLPPAAPKDDSEEAVSTHKELATRNEANAEKWREAVESAEDVAGFTSSHTWSAEKIEGYNTALHGKILIPQPFGAKLRNAYEVESGFAVSKYMLIELIAALVVIAMFAWLANRLRGSEAPRGRLTNMLEVILIYFRDNVARPAIDSHDHGHDEHGHDEPHEQGDEELHLGDVHLGSEVALTAHHEEHEGDKFVPLLWTFFSFILICNLFGLTPWLGSPTAAFGCTIGLALVTFFTGIGCGMMRYGPIGFFTNQVPSMDLPFGMGYVIKPFILLIEMGGMLIKHGVLAVRLLANMVAGHLVILGILGLAFTLEAAASMSTTMWGVTATISIIGSTLFYCLELFVAFLQAYIFTFLSALFIGSAIHKH